MKILSGLLLEDGQGLTEYVFVLSAIVVIVVGGLILVGSGIFDLYTEANSTFN